MKLRIYGGYLTDHRRFYNWCDERAKTDPLFAKCYEEQSFGELAVESYAKKKEVPWWKKINVDYLPCQKDELGDVDPSQHCTIFAFRDYEYDGPLVKFSRWDLFQETNTDREYKAQIEELGIELGVWTVVSYVGPHRIFYNFSPEVVASILERMKAKLSKIQEAKAKKAKSQIEELGIALGPWTVVGIVGKQGLFYDFSPEVAAAILERMKAEYNQMEEAKARKVAQVARATNTRLTAKEDTATTDPTGILPVDR